MHYIIDQGTGCVRAELFGRETAAETQDFIRALTGEVQKNGCTAVLVTVRNSRPIFKLDPHEAAGQLRRLAASPGYRVALLADTEELRTSHEYIEVLARQQGANVRAFRDEPSALLWLGLSPRKSGRTGPTRS
jgi:hypothetical protein